VQPEEMASPACGAGIRFPADMNGVLSLCSMFAAKAQDLVVPDHQNLSNPTRVNWLYWWGKLLSTIAQNEKYKTKMTKKVK